MSDADAWARLIASGVPVRLSVAVVVAHADDETLWAGAALGRMADCRLIHLTDSSPHDPGDALRLGFDTRQAYADARERELDAALTALGASPQRFAYGVPDQAAVEHIPALAERLTADCAGVAVIATHPYEGGHPDHDAAALAVCLAADRLGVPVIEFASYNLHGGERVWARFEPDPGCPDHSRPLLPDERARIDRALAAHVSQVGVFGEWRPQVERWRAAPRYDFTRPPPGEGCLYDGFGWTLTSERWRERAAAWA
ncbi:PIG-L deacetylase family protein [uncultured Sphingomonas sp.]|uniref:PIG-L deacetylase family protein n=1 Tax=uncultured Sphingomonas sp. TaxID=158754 RepID=UPI0035C99190